MIEGIKCILMKQRVAFLTHASMKYLMYSSKTPPEKPPFYGTWAYQIIQIVCQKSAYGPWASSRGITVLICRPYKS